MARHKDQNWNLPEGTLQADGSRTHSWDSIHAALTMDLRDELKRLNEVLHCVHFLNIPRKLDAIRRNTAPRKRKKV